VFVKLTVSLHITNISLYHTITATVTNCHVDQTNALPLLSHAYPHSTLIAVTCGYRARDNTTGNTNTNTTGSGSGTAFDLLFDLHADEESAGSICDGIVTCIFQSVGQGQGQRQGQGQSQGQGEYELCYMKQTQHHRVNTSGGSTNTNSNCNRMDNTQLKCTIAACRDKCSHVALLTK